ncbi:peptidoglycan-recognition protein LF-like [Macrosteles quadrilineatus]|uniref:peptidoglycan-recognition protein LF-like n=1 Tax=Macrosteles quadrilineatus TaxID=74068 RepID=UPI0023E1B4DB|nr:peptidoglycan-recognition protein LF-like [Macrosteles quadrilineatus]
MASGYERTKKKTTKLNPQDNYREYPSCDITIPLIRRRYWFGVQPNELKLNEMAEPHKKICFVSSESPECSNMEDCVVHVQELQKRNVVFKGWPEIPFNFIITGDGNIYEGRGWLNKYINFGNEAMQETLQIAYLGYFKDKDPSPQMVDLGTKLIEYGKQRKFISEDYTYMECPLQEYYLFPKAGLDAYYNSPEFKAFQATMPPPPPPRPPKPTNPT